MSDYEYLNHQETCWTVRIDGPNGAGIAATGTDGGRALFRRKTDAKLFSDELQEHLESKCSVIQITASFEEIPF